MRAAIKLSRALPVEAWRVVATVGVATEREWEPAVLRHVADEGGTTIDRLAEHLLNRRKAIAERLLWSCERLGLLSHERGGFRLTDSGRIAADTGVILIPERGTWTLWFSRDPMLPSPLLALEPYQEPSTRDDQLRAKRNEAPRKVVKLPEQVARLEGRTTDVLRGKYGQVRFDELQPAAEQGDLGETRLALYLELTPQRATASVRGRLASESIDVRLPTPALAYDEAWRALLTAAGVFDRWDAQREVLRVSFDDTSRQERATLQRDLAVKRPGVGAWGVFDDTVIAGVDLAPRTHADAGAWACWRLEESIQDTATRSKYADWSAEAVAPFGLPTPVTPARRELAARLRGTDRPRPAYWRLQAAEDWNL